MQTKALHMGMSQLDHSDVTDYNYKGLDPFRTSLRKDQRKKKKEFGELKDNYNLNEPVRFVSNG